MVTGTTTDLDSINFMTRLRSFKKMSINIREWGSNSEIFVQHLPDENHISSQVLGIQWDIRNHCLSIPGKMVKCRNLMKIEILKITASTYDPFGYFMPVTLRAKLYYRRY